MKKFLSIVIIFSSFVAYSQDVAPKKESGSKFSLTCKNLYFEIDSAMGARISSFTLDGSEIMYVDFNTTDMAGSTFWQSPQTWPWPPALNLDKNPYKTTISGNKILFTGAIDNNSKLRFYKTMFATNADTSISIQYVIKNEKTTAQKWAPWEITRVLASGLTVFAKETGSVTGDMTSRTEEQNGYVWYDQDATNGGAGNKFFCNGKGWLAHVIDGNMLFIKKFTDVASGQAAPKENEVEVYTAPGNQYTELENQGAYTSIASKDSSTWTVKWFARKLPASVTVSVGSQSLTKYIEDVLSRAIDPGTKVAAANMGSVKVYPNPAASYLKIETGNLPLINTTLNLFDLQGKQVLSKTITGSNEYVSIKSLTQGSYFYDLRNGSNIITKGIVAVVR